ncbi:MAG: methyltransferase [Candidatus Paceibacterota bacterium]|jgi:protein-S-isoprenylcysteine O-methyltransferase Ste14
MENINQPNARQYRVHKILAHSYTLYLILFLIGVCLDILFKFRIFLNPFFMSTGVVLLILGSFLIIWAQKTSRDLNIENLSKETFHKGPYRYTRSPTHWGLFMLVLGFGIVANALFVILSTLVSFSISRSIFLKKQEDVLALKYGAPYLEYKKSVKL